MQNTNKPIDNEKFQAFLDKVRAIVSKYKEKQAEAVKQLPRKSDHT